MVVLRTHCALSFGTLAPAIGPRLTSSLPTRKRPAAAAAPVPQSSTALSGRAEQTLRAVLDYVTHHGGRLPSRHAEAAVMQVSSYSDDKNMLFRPCVDCGQITGSFCDGYELVNGDPCFAAARMPNEPWAEMQRTPLCTTCERKYSLCRYCRGTDGCTPPAWQLSPPPSLSGLAVLPPAAISALSPASSSTVATCFRDIYCSVCDMWLNGPEQYATHAPEKKHQKNMRKAIARVQRDFRARFHLGDEAGGRGLDFLVGRWGQKKNVKTKGPRHGPGRARLGSVAI